jgi:integrase
VQRVVAAQVETGCAALTFGRLVERYMNEYVYRNCKASTAGEARRLLDRASAYFGDDKPARNIVESDIVDLISVPPRKGGRSNGGLSEATNLLGAVRRCFRWARRTINPDTKRRYVDVDPSAEIPKPLKNKRSRERVLSDDEIISFWRGCGDLGWPFGPIFRLLLLTAQRRNEVAGMRWSELDLDGKVWHLPGSRTKSSRPHDVHLSDLAIDIIQALPRFVPSPGRPDFLFSSKGDVAVSGFAYAKSNLDEVMPATDGRLHDLRRTVTTGLARLKIQPPVGHYLGWGSGIQPLCVSRRAQGRVGCVGAVCRGAGATG